MVVGGYTLCFFVILWMKTCFFLGLWIIFSWIDDVAVFSGRATNVSGRAATLGGQATDSSGHPATTSFVLKSPWPWHVAKTCTPLVCVEVIVFWVVGGCGNLSAGLDSQAASQGGRPADKVCRFA